VPEALPRKRGILLVSNASIVANLDGAYARNLGQRPNSVLSTDYLVPADQDVGMFG
jgi:hypothetical protein